MLRRLDRDQAANEMVDAYASHHDSNKEILDLSTDPFRRDIEDSYLINAFSEAVNKIPETREIGTVIKQIALDSSWGQDDQEFLSSCTVDDYYDFFKSEESPNLMKYVQSCLRFERSSDEDRKAIAQKAIEAMNCTGASPGVSENGISFFFYEASFEELHPKRLKQIARESKLNRIRVSKKYGIELTER